MKKQILSAAGILTAGLIAGSAFSVTAAANAADEVNSVASTNSVATTDNAAATNPAGVATDAKRPDIFSATSIKPGESLVTGDALDKIVAAAKAEVADATVIRAENDSDGDKYEVHMKKADGSVVTVTFDENFKVTGTHEGFADPAKGGPAGGPKGGHGLDGDNDGPAAGGFQLDSTTTQNN
jgi:uncharacterized membrane protein YkoI